ncbi:hypothetical protein [Pseudoxanthomonas putridarboris]|uniref:Uncharacterized protein n=1 Tax=Pseudoxanthomonas putridarboris TaxID=752605 RepID=A0ABU9J275_9GAMM
MNLTLVTGTRMEQAQQDNRFDPTPQTIEQGLHEKQDGLRPGGQTHLPRQRPWIVITLEKIRVWTRPSLMELSKQERTYRGLAVSVWRDDCTGAWEWEIFDRESDLHVDGGSAKTRNLAMLVAACREAILPRDAPCGLRPGGASRRWWADASRTASAHILLTHPTPETEP